MEDELHYPPGAEPEKPADAPASEADKPEDDKAPEAVPKPEGEEKATGVEPKPEAAKPEDKKPEDPPEPKLPKKRSIYDELKDERAKRKEAEDEVERLKNGGKPAEEPAKPAAPSDPEKPADELEAYAQENDLDAKELGRLADILAKRIPRADLSDEDKAALSDLKSWRAQQARSAEDTEVRATAPTVQKELGITDATELGKVMDEVVRLSHTPEFHDKEVDYIVWKNKDALSKLVSPKKPSFESGGQNGDAPPEPEPDFSTGKVTPEQAAKHMTRPKPGYDIRSSNQS